MVNLPEHCKRAREALDRRLDGEIPGDPPDVASHRLTCGACRADESAALRMVLGLNTFAPEVLPADFAERVLAMACVAPAAPSRLTRWWLPSLALAASVMIAVFVIRDQTTDRYKPEVATVPVKIESAARPAPLGESLAEAGEAVAVLSRKTVINAPEVKLPSFSLPTEGPLDRLEPAVASLQNMGNGVVLSISPLTNSVRRAADLVWTELASDTDAEPKVN